MAVWQMSWSCPDWNGIKNVCVFVSDKQILKFHQIFSSHAVRAACTGHRPGEIARLMLIVHLRHVTCLFRLHRIWQLALGNSPGLHMRVITVSSSGQCIYTYPSDRDDRPIWTWWVVSSLTKSFYFRNTYFWSDSLNLERSKKQW